MNSLGYSVVIPTCGRADALRETLAALENQTRAPDLVVIVDSSTAGLAENVARHSSLPVRYERSTVRSAAHQRNLGAVHVVSPIIAFIDDDITLSSNASAEILTIFEKDDAGQIGGMAARIEDIDRPVPSRLLRWYYRLQAGFADSTYGGRLFGPAINCLPCYTESDGNLIPADWLNSGCVFYRTSVFQREKFPQFDGYSFMEDVHLSARMAKTHRLFFHRTALCHHRDTASESRENVMQIARMRIRNQRLVARDVMLCSGVIFELKFFLHRLFATVSIARRRGLHWHREILGTWT